MQEKLKYVSPEYQERLDRLAELLCTPERLGETAMGQLILFPVREEIPDEPA